MASNSRLNSESIIIIFGSILAVIIIGFLFWAWPQYNVYQARLAGQAALQHAQYEREVQVQDAKGQKEAAQMLADANAIIGPALTPEYLKYLELRTLREGFDKGNVIYFYGGSSPVVVPASPTKSNSLVGNE
jgi:hypothetical protein